MKELAPTEQLRIKAIWNQKELKKYLWLSKILLSPTYQQDLETAKALALEQLTPVLGPDAENSAMWQSLDYAYPSWTGLVATSFIDVSPQTWRITHGIAKDKAQFRKVYFELMKFVKASGAESLCDPQSPVKPFSGIKIQMEVKVKVNDIHYRFHFLTQIPQPQVEQLQAQGKIQFSAPEILTPKPSIVCNVPDAAASK